MPEPSLVSIIIPVYNSALFIAETIQSAINQTWCNVEIIVIDDGSTDNSLAIAKTFECERIHIIKQVNKGASAARNLGLKFAKGEYIQFLDADDLLSSNKIELQMNLLRDFPCHIGLCGTVYFTNGESTLTHKPIHTGYAEGSENPVDFLIKLYGGDLIEEGFGGMIQPNAWLTPMKIIDQAGLWNTNLTLDDDGEFFCRILLASKGVKYSYDAINYYRKHTNSKNLSSRNTYDAYKSMLESNKLKLEYILSTTSSSNAKLAMARIFWESCFTFYPRHKNLALEASHIARSLDSSFKYNPYNGNKNLLSYLIGWKKVKALQHMKHLILFKLGLRKYF